MKRFVAAAAAAVLLSASGVLAATKKPDAAGGPPNAMQGFSQNRGQPVHIEAARLEVRDKDKVATFLGNVVVIQGDVELRCKTLVVFYEQDADAQGANADANTLPAAAPGPGGAQRIKRLEAKGGVVVTQNDQVATGDVALFDMATNTVTMIGKVVVTQGPSVVRGDRLVVDMTTGLSRVESADKGGEGRVQGLFLPGSATTAPGATAGSPGTKPNTATTKPATPAPQGTMPMRLN